MSAGAYADYGWEDDRSYSEVLVPTVAALLPATGAILDVGCGNGALTHALLARGFDVYGTDGSEKGIALARAKAPARFFRHLIGEPLPDALAGRTFAAVVSTEVIEHLYDPAAFLAGCRALLAPGGVLVLSTPYHGYLKNMALSLVNGWDRHWSPLWRGGHIKFWSRATLEQAVREAGLTPFAFAGVGRLPFLWKSMIVAARF